MRRLFANHQRFCLFTYYATWCFYCNQSLQVFPMPSLIFHSHYSKLKSWNMSRLPSVRPPPVALYKRRQHDTYDRILILDGSNLAMLITTPAKESVARAG